MNLPNLIFVGAEKSGSTTIHRVLSEQCDIFSIRKETEFFSFYNKKLVRDYYINQIEEYSRLFQNSEKFTYRMDVSTTYLHSPNAIKNIKLLLKDVKILICLRNPIERAYSRYWMSAKNNFNLTQYSSQKFIDYFYNHHTDIPWSNVRERGLYSNSIKLFYKNFKKKNILVIFYDDLKSNENSFFEKIFKFLKIKNPVYPKKKIFADSLYSKNRLLHYLFNISIKNGLPNNTFFRLSKNLYKKYRQRFLIKYPLIGNQEKKELLKFYSKDITELEELLKINLNKWKKI